MATREEIIQTIVDYCWWLDTDEITKVELRQAIMEDLMPKLHSQGVVIRAERELPEFPLDAFDNDKVSDAIFSIGIRDRQYANAGYEKVEPLIKEIREEDRGA